MAYATVEELMARHPNEAALVAADETTRLADPTRLAHALEDASLEIRSILAARWSKADLERLDEDGAATLAVYACDIALYRAALSASRLTEEMRERAQAALKRLEGLAAGRGALTFLGVGGAAGEATEMVTSPGDVLVDGPPRVFSRRAYGGA
ncbi:MAG: DUF1320 family protein [Rhodoblastus sp.]|nr:MAG: DUF1320 family protein [Rhodoblastus sp.]